MVAGAAPTRLRPAFLAAQSAASASAKTSSQTNGSPALEALTPQLIVTR